MIDYSQIAVAVLAAGASTRFGGNKLQAHFGKGILGCHILDQLAQCNFSSRYAVVTDLDDQLSQTYKQFSFALIENTNPPAGLSQSVKLAVSMAQTSQADALLICLADMPFVDSNHIGRLCAAYRQTEEIIASAHNGIAMPPAIFPRKIWGALLKTTGDSGARDLIRHAKCIEANAAVLRDIDTPQDLAAAQRTI